MVYDSQSGNRLRCFEITRKERCSRLFFLMDAPLVMHVLSMAHSFFARKSHQLKMEKYLHRVKPGRPELIVWIVNLTTHRICWKSASVWWAKLRKRVAKAKVLIQAPRKSRFQHTDHNHDEKYEALPYGKSKSFHSVMALLHPLLSLLMNNLISSASEWEQSLVEVHVPIALIWISSSLNPLYAFPH
jgi:hypothetical protein